MKTINWFFKTRIGNMALAAIWCILFGTLAENVHIDFIIPMYIGVTYFIIIFLVMMYYPTKRLGLKLIKFIKSLFNK